MRALTMVLKINHVSFDYPDGVSALRDINLEVPNKSFVVILGESGCGKTTLLKVIAGLLDPQQGQVIINDEDVTTFTTASRDLTMLFQEFSLIPHMTVYENVLMSLNGIKLTNEEKDKLVKAILEQFGLRHYINLKPRHLSVGQKQRVAICKSLIREPQLFLMDEPLASLDLSQKFRLKIELKNIFNNVPSSFIYVTHDYLDAEYLADYLVIMDKGKIIQTGTFKEIRDNPKTIKTATLINGGNINSFEVSVVSNQLKNDDFTLKNTAKHEQNKNILIIPYKSLVLKEDGPIKGEFMSSKLVNGDQLITVKLPSGNMIYAQIQDDEIEFKEKDIVCFDVLSYYLFPAK